MNRDKVVKVFSLSNNMNDNDETIYSSLKWMRWDVDDVIDLSTKPNYLRMNGTDVVKMYQKEMLERDLRILAVENEHVKPFNWNYFF